MGRRCKSMVTMTTRNKFALGLTVVLAIVAAIIYWPGGGDPDSSDPDQRLAAARALEGKTDEASVAVLRRLSNDRETRVVLAAVSSIKRGRTAERNRKALVTILAESDSPVARSAAATALGHCPEVDVNVLTAVLSNRREDPIVRAGAAKGLAGRRDGKSIPRLVDALEDPDPRVRLWAITAIGRMTALRFDYDAARPPAEQREKIRHIRETLIARKPRR